MTTKPYPPIGDMIEACNEAVVDQMESGVEIFNSWECKFVDSLEGTLVRYGNLSAKQLAKLQQIYDKTAGE